MFSQGTIPAMFGPESGHELGVALWQEGPTVFSLSVNTFIVNKWPTVKVNPLFIDFFMTCGRRIIIVHKCCVKVKCWTSPC